MIIIGLVNIVRMQMLGLPPHARCAINSGDDLDPPLETKCLLPQANPIHRKLKWSLYFLLYHILAPFCKAILM